MVLAADEVGNIDIDLVRELPAIELNPLLHFVMATSLSEVASDSNCEMLERVLHDSGASSTC